MAASSSTISLSNAAFGDIGGAVSDLFAGTGAATQAGLKGRALNIQAQGDRLQAQGMLAEATEYDLGTGLAQKNEAYTEQSTAIQVQQQQRENLFQIGGQKAAVAGAGFANSGSAYYLAEDAAKQGALAVSVLEKQGAITEAGYQEQAQSYQTMAGAARTAAAGENEIAGETDQLAAQTVQAGKEAETGDFISGAIKGAAAVASIAMMF